MADNNKVEDIDAYKPMTEEEEEARIVAGEREITRQMLAGLWDDDVVATPTKG